MKKALVTASAAILLLLGVSACDNPEPEGGSDQTDSSSIVESVEKDESIAAKLPKKYQEQGGFTVSINPDVEPVKFTDSDGEIAGMNPDLLRAAGRVLDAEVRFQKGTFDGMVPGLEAKRFDAISSVADFVERQDNIDFIDYLKNGTAIITAADFQDDSLELKDLCGLSVGYARGTSQQGSLEEASKACVDNGDPEISMNGYGDSGAGILAVESSAADAFWGDLPQMSYNVQQSPDAFKIVYDERVSILGIGIHKDNTEFRDALHAALLKLVEDGTYDKLLASWGLEDAAHPEMNINSDLSLEG
ncbi:ABC transporter substrate-binding protein [Brevibacterium sp. S111]|uniref:ABC transporter substrate-binding protein n=1 Tax=Brevibacterium sp. S111 TaxID=2483795 RepID=UPI001436C97E|nr:ABC transporter substrate-binding protein [Brevibacterium sp. S111]